MPKTRAPYAHEFRRQMVDLVRAGRDPDDLAREFEPTRSRSATGSQLPASSRAAGRRRVRHPRTPTNWSGCAARCGSYARSATSSQKRRPGSRGRPALCRPGLRVHERASGQVSDHRHGARAWGVEGGLLYLAQAGAVGTRLRMTPSCCNASARSTPPHARPTACRACMPSCGQEARGMDASGSPG